MLSRIEGAIATRKAGSTGVAWEVHTRITQPVNLRQNGVVLFNRGATHRPSVHTTASSSPGVSYSEGQYDHRDADCERVEPDEPDKRQYPTPGRTAIATPRTTE